MLLKTVSSLCLMVLLGLFGLSACSVEESPEVSAIAPNNREDSVKSIIADFDSATESAQWRTVDDNVMGGLSQGNLVNTQASTGLFSGTLSLENNGGFSSVRRGVDGLAVGIDDAIALRIKGDGRRYQFRLKMDTSDRAISYRAEFDTTADEWTVVSLPLSNFEPVFRGRVIADAPSLVPSEVEEIGFLLASKQDGAFALEIDWIRSNTE